MGGWLRGGARDGGGGDVRRVRAGLGGLRGGARGVGVARDVGARGGLGISGGQGVGLEMAEGTYKCTSKLLTSQCDSVNCL